MGFGNCGSLWISCIRAWLSYWPQPPAQIHISSVYFKQIFRPYNSSDLISNLNLHSKIQLKLTKRSCEAEGSVFGGGSGGWGGGKVFFFDPNWVDRARDSATTSSRPSPLGKSSRQVREFLCRFTTPLLPILRRREACAPQEGKKASLSDELETNIGVCCCWWWDRLLIPSSDRKHWGGKAAS